MICLHYLRLVCALYALTRNGVAISWWLCVCIGEDGVRVVVSVSV